MELLKKQPTMKPPVEWLVIWTPSGEEHWHGAAPDHFMTHIALWETDEVDWLEHVSDDQYGGPRTSTRR
ncbi:hypothetical protein ACFRCW_36800 [Streptomyces sp. NPDC056653]|uniref:hypothetical protein n=1 Tax=Streptomyces sp. NPDC056653 TaxID=3345894 RepID=UPI003693D106